MNVVKRILGIKPNGHDPLEELNSSCERLSRVLRDHSRAAERLVRHKKEDEMAQMIARYRINEGGK